MTTNHVKKALLNRELTLGSWIQINNPAVAEILANTGFDWLAADCEHTDINVEGFVGLARGMHGRGASPMVRVRENNTLVIRQMLDAGAEGIIVPLIDNAEQAKAAVAATKYPPKGVRGFCFSRMNNYGNDFESYAKTANDNIAVVVMIESKEAVENIDSILAVEGVDGVFIGPYDMSGSYGIPGKTDDRLVQNGCAKVLNACEKAKKSAGLHVVIPTRENICKAISDGFTFIALGVDTVFLNQSSQAALQIAKQAITKS